MNLRDKAFASGVLDPVTHQEFVSDILHIAAEANVPLELLWTPMETYCGKDEIDFVKGLRRHTEKGIYGLMYYGGATTPVQTRMLCAAGACLRNFVNSKVMTVQDVLTRLKADDVPNPTVLFIPNFYLGKKDGGYIPDWQVSMLLGLLYTRQSEGKQTVVYIQDLQMMELDYGAVFSNHFTAHFMSVGA